MSSIAPITIVVLTLETFSHEMSGLTALETTRGIIVTDARLITITLGTGRRLSTSFNHTTLRLSWSILEFLRFMDTILTSVSVLRCTCR